MARSIPDAKVVATNVATGAKQEVLSTDAGLYLFPALPVSLYSVTVEKAGFKKLNRQNIEIRVAQRLDMDLRLEVGEVQQTVEVTCGSAVARNFGSGAWTEPVAEVHGQSSPLFGRHPQSTSVCELHARRHQ